MSELSLMCTKCNGSGTSLPRPEEIAQAIQTKREELYKLQNAYKTIPAGSSKTDTKKIKKQVTVCKEQLATLQVHQQRQRKGGTDVPCLNPECPDQSQISSCRIAQRRIAPLHVCEHHLPNLVMIGGYLFWKNYNGNTYEDEYCLVYSGGNTYEGTFVPSLLKVGDAIVRLLPLNGAQGEDDANVEYGRYTIGISQPNVITEYEI